MRDVTARAQSLIRAIGRERALDPVADKVAGVVDAATRSAPVKNVLSGTWLGHRLHPVLTDLPIGAWSAAVLLDATGADEAAARRLVGAGIVASAPTAIAGFSDWSGTSGADRRIGLVHGLANGVASLLQASSWLTRRRGHRGAGAVLSALGLGVTLASAYLGGHLVFARGVGVSPTSRAEPADEQATVAAGAGTA